MVRVGVAVARVWRMAGPEGRAGAVGSGPRSAGAARVMSDPDGVHCSIRDGLEPCPPEDVPRVAITRASPAGWTLPSAVEAIHTCVASSRCARKASREPSGDHMRSLMWMPSGRSTSVKERSLSE